MLSVVLLASTFNITAGALTEGKHKFTETSTGVSYNFPTRVFANGEWHSGQGTLTMRTLTATGEPLYCLEPYDSATGSGVTALPLDKTPAWTSLNDNAIDGITYTSIYGYRGTGKFAINGTTYDRVDAYVATQMLIWEWISAYRTNFTASASRPVTNALNDTQESCYNAILTKCKNHDNQPQIRSVYTERFLFDN